MLTAAPRNTFAPRLPHRTAARRIARPTHRVDHPSTYFAAARVISLERTPDRFDAFRARFPGDWPFCKPGVFSAVDGTVCPVRHGFTGGGPAFGCLQSHRSIVLDAIAQQAAGPVLILEDDATLVPHATRQLVAALSVLPDDVDLLFIGGQHFKPTTPVADGIVRCGETGRTHAYVIYPRFFNRFIDLTGQWNTHIDHGLQHWAKTLDVNFYALDPFIAYQDSNLSTITYKQEPARSWDSRVDVTCRAVNNVPVVRLQAPRQVVCDLRHRALIHTGYWRDGNDIDRGLVDLLSRPPEQHEEALRDWINVVRRETAAYPSAVLALWGVELDPEMLTRITGVKVPVIETQDCDGAIAQISSLFDASRRE